MGLKLMGVSSNDRKNIDCFEDARGQGFFSFFSFLRANAKFNNFFSTKTIVLIFFSPANILDFSVDVSKKIFFFLLHRFKCKVHKILHFYRFSGTG
jgi:hypothetical protein